MRNASHMKKFTQPGPCTETQARKQGNETPTTEQSEGEGETGRCSENKKEHIKNVKTCANGSNIAKHAW